ncbi:MAG TPA: DMT family transporter [Planctomycetota bacterium]|nr:DMT family transporter [Planctomycetota bacterium]
MKGAALLMIALANVIGGSTYLAQKLALEGLPAATVTALRNAIAMACLALWAARSGRIRLGFTRREHVRLALAGILGYALPLLLGIWGLHGSTSGNASILILLEPPAILLFSWLLLRERLRGLQLLGIAAGLAGALWIVAGDPGQGGQLGELVAGRYLGGNAILALHGVMWGLYSPLMLPLARRHRPSDVTFAAMAWAMLLLVPAALLEAGEWRGGPALSPALLWTLALGVVASFGGTILWVEALRHLDGSTVAPFVFLQPLAGVLAGHLVLDERLSGAALAGGALIGAGVALVLAPGFLRAAAARPESRSGSGSSG